MTLHSHIDPSARHRAGLRSRAVALTVVTTAGLLTALAPPVVAQAAVRAAVLGAPALPTLPALSAVAAGKLPINGCVEGAATAACDLYAMSGTATILGAPIPIWGFSTTGVADSATAPGPVLVVRQGDAVTVTLHNQLVGQTVSLALPGQVGVTVGGTVGDDTTGISTGTRAYSFTAGRPGTFLYEAGHTSGGARQVAMGLAGALVVLPADGTAYGTATSAYDDEAVLVLTEVDPAFNADPGAFDLRNFQPAYRLINGRPFPAADPISTDQGHRLLLRYVNVGSLPHTMTLLGAGQNLIAQDGHLMAYPAASVTQTVAPGATADSTVAVPPGSDAKFALYESAQHLDNAGQHNADPLQLAFGGMLTFVDTNAPVPSSDGVGPVATHISVTPNPSDGLGNATVTADLSDAATGGSNVTQAEFVIDDAVATGAGFGVPLTGTFGTVSVTGATGVIPATAGNCQPPSGPVPVSLQCLAAGKHQLFVRALDSSGNWGVIGSTIFNLPKTGPQTLAGSATSTPANGSADVSISATGDDSAAGGVITNAEYFIDTVGANGAGIALTVNRAAAIVSEDGDILAATVTGLGEGMHHVFVHSKDSLGLWGPPLDIPLNVDLTGPSVDAAAVGPNPTNGLISDKSNPGYLMVSAQITDRDAGNGLQNLLADAEAFLDPKVANPTGGTGLNMIAVDGRLDSTTEAVYGLLPLSQAKALTDGVHHVFVRGQDNAGNWGALFAVNLLVDKVAPVLGTLTASPNPSNGASSVTLSAPLTELNTLGGSEFWTGTVDPGVGRGTALPVSVAAGQVSVSVPVLAMANGTYTFNLRVQDLAGNWSKSKSISVAVVKPNAIFADDFNSGTTAAWTTTTGTAAVTAAAGIPVAAGNLGLAVTLPGNATNSPKFLTDGTPAGETTYHAQFAFNPNTLTSGTNPATAVITIFDAQNAANASMFSVQYRVSGTARQVRTVMTRSAGAAITSAWVTLATGARTLKIDWAAGPATGPTAGSVKLSVDGVVTLTSTGVTNTLRIDSARLGVISGFSVGSGANRSAGTAYFDSFVSTRYTLP